jgi:hypothetical protein
MSEMLNVMENKEQSLEVFNQWLVKQTDFNKDFLVTDIIPKTNKFTLITTPVDPKVSPSNDQLLLLRMGLDLGLKLSQE